MTETRYERVAREQRERQEARAKRMAEAAKPKRRKRPASSGPSYMHDSGPGFFRDPDGLDRDNLGESPDH